MKSTKILLASIGMGAAALATTAQAQFIWTARTSGTANDLNGVEFFNGASNMFIAVGDAGTFLTSADHGKTWTARPGATTGLGISDHMLAVAKGTPGAGDRYVATGENGVVYTTNLNGVNVAQDINAASTDDLVDVVWAFNQFFAFDDQGEYHTSTDGASGNWTAAQDIDTTANFDLVAAEFDGVVLKVVAQSGRVYVTNDGSAWFRGDGPNGFFSNYQAIGLGDGRFVATQSGGRWMTATRTSDTVAPFCTFSGFEDTATLFSTTDIAFGLSRFLASGNTNDGSFYFAPKAGNSWTPFSFASPFNTANFNGAAFGKRFVLVGNSGVILTTDHPADLLVGKKVSSQIGDDVYTETGAGQSVTQRTKKRKKVKIYVKAENDGPDDTATDGDFTFLGSRKNRFFKVSYFKTTGGTQNITAQAITGNYLIDDLPCDDECQFRVDIKPTGAAKNKKKTRRLTFVITSVETSVKDVGKGTVKKSKK